MKEYDVTLSDRELTHIIYALAHYENVLLEDEEDPGPSTDDAMFVRHIMERLQEIGGRQDG